MKAWATILRNLLIMLMLLVGVPGCTSLQNGSADSRPTTLPPNKLAAPSADTKRSNATPLRALISAQKLIKTTVADCQIRGGEFYGHPNIQPEDMVDCLLPGAIRSIGSLLGGAIGGIISRDIEILASAYDYLYRPGIEKPSYGLYSYVLLPNASQRSERLLAEVFATTSYVEINQIQPTNVNLMYIPVKADALSTLIPLVQDGSAPPTGVFARDHYDYGLAQKILAQICRSPTEAVEDICSSDLSRGPYLFTFPSPASGLESVPAPYLFVDLSNVHDRAFGEFVAAYKAQVKRPDFSDMERIDDLRLSLLSIVLTAADWVGPITGILAESVRISGAEAVSR